jgi:hypothetical protein
LYQQKDWTPSFMVETTVNLYSLYVQSIMGQPSRLDAPGEGGPGFRQIAAQYLARSDRDFSDDKMFAADGAVWGRLVMLDRLRAVLGDDFYRKLHRDYRHNPLGDDELSDASKLNVLAYRSSVISGFDLTGFFDRWGVKLTRQTRGEIKALNLPQPSSRLLEVK